ncbi:MAG: hypothetical protein Fur0044_03860 [Anaerolineae bacterium]|nr:hypothetical protein [Anaerolineales bacterium]MCQ3972246.1 hypothetical protein [Anaerolineae bacterium]
MIIQRNVLHEAIDKLPENALDELAKFIEFLQFKIQYDEFSAVPNLIKESDMNWQIETQNNPPFNPVHFPEGILTGFDFSPEYIATARKELWLGIGADFE